MLRLKYVVTVIVAVMFIFIWRNSIKHIPDLKEMKANTDQVIEETKFKDYVQGTSFIFHKKPSEKEVVITVKVKLKEAFLNLTEPEQYLVMSLAQRYLYSNYQHVDSYQYFFGIKATYENEEYFFNDKTENLIINGEKVLSRDVLQELDLASYHIYEPYTSNGHLKVNVYHFVERLYNLITQNGRYYNPKEHNEIIISETRKKFSLSLAEIRKVCQYIFIYKMNLIE
ncbi:hypothetical protein [Bacillus massiliigorillae]|uniref:hypothetical protein n=1 Tax=Bacillus massiliigorillae TaxID=1243664 RepID=UPI0003A59178|nr:hypothetical protein [Bacillus massiliigorillae]